VTKIRYAISEMCRPDYSRITRLEPLTRTVYPHIVHLIWRFAAAPSGSRATRTKLATAWNDKPQYRCQSIGGLSSAPAQYSISLPASDARTKYIVITFSSLTRVKWRRNVRHRFTHLYGAKNPNVSSTSWVASEGNMLTDPLVVGTIAMLLVIAR